MAPIWPIFSKSKTSHKVLSSESIYETVNGSYEYKLKGYSLAKGIGVGKSISSRKFTVCGHDWVIIFYPDGDSQINQEYVSLYLMIVSPGQVRAACEFKFLDQSDKGKHGVHKISTVKSPITFTQGVAGSCGYRQYMKRSELESSSYLKDDCLAIRCTIGVVKTRDGKVQTIYETVQTRAEEEKDDVIPVPPSDMIQNLKGLLDSEIGFDVTFHVGSEFFRAHKCILAARSPVFRAQFFGLVGNPGMEAVAIEEFEPFAFKAMLLYLYSDELPEPHELSVSDSPCTSTTILQHLLVAADRFDLPRLRLMCEAELCKEINASTVATTLAIAERHQCLQLKTICLKFAAKPEILGGVMKSDGYAYLEKWYPSLLTDLLKTGAVVDKK